MTDGLLLEGGGRKVRCLPQRHTGWLWLRQGQKEGCLVLPRHKKAFFYYYFLSPPPHSSKGFGHLLLISCQSCMLELLKVLFK